MQKEEPASGTQSDSSAPVKAAKIGLISALIVATCGLLGTTVTVAGAALNACFTSQAAQASILLSIHATQTAEARPVPSATIGGTPTTEARINPTSTRVPPTPSPGPAVFLVRNKLVLPIRVYVNGVSRGSVSAQSEKAFPLDREPARVVWDIVKETTTEGRALGDAMEGTFDSVHLGQVITVGHVVGDQAYFYPIITNLTDSDCEVTINRGWQSENVTNAVVPANSNNVGLGYFRLFTNSNVTLDCDPVQPGLGGDLYWWGLRPDESSGTSFYDDVDPDTGTISFTLKP